jgi:hypothetical protein
MRAQQTAVAPRGSSRRIAELIAHVATNGRPKQTVSAAG